MSSEGTGQQPVVVGVDGSAASVAALKWAAHYAEATGATVLAMLAWHYPTAGGQPPIGVAPEIVHDESEHLMAEALGEAVSQAATAYPGARIEAKTVYGHPAEALIDASKEAALLVVGSRGHGAFRGMLVGSVSIHCVTGAHCPVVVVRGH
ncbi:MAG TPA: universal stress protein [Streptosporangiaceae bacterium]|jgi:nucleotide-binding universal stress UspA family protein